MVNAARLAGVTPPHDTAEEIASGDGSATIRDFAHWAVTHGVRAVGGLPAGFAGSPIPNATRVAIRTLFTNEGARFIDLGDRGRYPRSAFFDTPDHLNEETQIARSRIVAAELIAILAPGRAASR